MVGIGEQMFFIQVLCIVNILDWGDNEAPEDNRYWFTVFSLGLNGGAGFKQGLGAKNGRKFSLSSSKIDIDLLAFELRIPTWLFIGFW